MLSRQDLTEINSWFDQYIEAIAENYNSGSSHEGFLSTEEFKELQNQAIVTHKKLNRMVNYIESRIVSLKGDLAEAKIFDTSDRQIAISARIHELQALIEEGEGERVHS